MMLEIFQKKSRLEVLKERYCYLMKKSYKTALTDLEKCEKFQNEATKIYSEINYLELLA